VFQALASVFHTSLKHSVSFPFLLVQEIFRDATAFLGIFPEGTADGKTSLLESQSWTADRTEFIGRNGTMERPAGLDHVSLSGRTGSFNETCGAIQQKLTLHPHSEQVVSLKEPVRPDSET